MKNLLSILLLWVIATLMRPAGGILHGVAFVVTWIWIVNALKSTAVSANQDNVDS